MSDKVSLAKNEDVPHVPAGCALVGYTGCQGCTQSSKHPTAQAFIPPKEGFARENRLSVLDNHETALARLQYGLWRRNYIAEGMMGSVGNPWWGINGRDTINYVYWATYKILSVSGDSITLEKPDGYDDARYFTRATWTENSPDDLTGIIKVTGFYRSGCIQPLAALRFHDNSVLAYAKEPVVLKVTSSSETEITLLLDQDVSAALTKRDTEDEDDLTVDVYQYASPEDYRYIVKPDYFFGVERQRIIEAADVPSNGVFHLETVPVMHPVGFDPMTPCWKLEGYSTEDGWEVVSQETERLFVTPTDAYVAFKTANPSEGIDSRTLTDDLTTDYTRFRVTYWRKGTGTESGCRAVGYARCRYSLPDRSGSCGTGYTGVGIGDGYYCSKRLVDNFTLTDEHGANPGDPPDGIRDTANHYYTSASGVERYPENGQCSAYGTCDMWAGAENYTGGDAPFLFSHHAGKILREAWMAVPHRTLQPQPVVPTKQVERILHPSLGALSGYVMLATSFGEHEQAQFSPGVGAYARYKVVTDAITGDESILVCPGPIEAWEADDPEGEADGLFPDRVENFKTINDPILPGTTMTQREMDRLGIGVERDTGEIKGDGLARHSYALPEQDLIIVSNVNASLMDTVQSGVMGEFERVTGGPSTVRVLPLRQELKTELVLESREVVAVSAAGGEVTITLKNGPHSHKTPVPLMGYDDGPTWLGGGCPPIYPPTHREIYNYYEVDKSTGARNRGAWRGDAVRDENGRMAVITEVLPHGGAEAADWGGGGTPTDNVSLDGAYLSYGKKQDVVKVLDDAQGTFAAITPGQSIVFVKSAIVMLPGATLEWTAYGTDDWQTVSGAVHYYGEGLWEIPDAWFAGKPEQLCFRAAGCQLMDHRGVIPASVVTKSAGAVEALHTVHTSWGGAAMETFSIGREAYRICNADGTATPISVVDSSYPTNAIGGGFSAPPAPPWNSCEGLASFFVNGTTIGLPSAIRRMPEGTTIVSAHCVIKCEGAQRTDWQWELVPNDPGPGYHYEYSSTVTDLPGNFTLLGATGNPAQWSVVHNFSAGAGEQARYVDVTSVVVAMQANAAAYHSFAIIPSGLAFALGDGVDDAVSSFIEDPPERVGDIDCDGDGNIDSGETNVIGGASGYNITYDDLHLGDLVVKFTLPDDDVERTLIFPAWPSMAPLS